MAVRVYAQVYSDLDTASTAVFLPGGQAVLSAINPLAECQSFDGDKVLAETFERMQRFTPACSLRGEVMGIPFEKRVLSAGNLARRSGVQSS